MSKLGPKKEKYDKILLMYSGGLDFENEIFQRDKHLLHDKMVARNVWR
ncbi:MAG: hypothetical protein ACTSRI_05270 [Promethearchaeota archaeon]